MQIGIFAAAIDFSLISDLGLSDFLMFLTESLFNLDMIKSSVNGFNEYKIVSLKRQQFYKMFFYIVICIRKRYLVYNLVFNIFFRAFVQSSCSQCPKSRSRKGSFFGYCFVKILLFCANSIVLMTNKISTNDQFSRAMLDLFNILDKT